MSSNDLAEIGIAKLSGALHTDVYSNPDAKGFSPNNVKGIEFLGSAGIEVVEHVQAGYYNLYRTGFDDLDLESIEALTVDDIQEIFSARKYGNLEYVSVSNDMTILGATGDTAAHAIVKALKGIQPNGSTWYGRLHQIKGASTGEYIEIEGTEDWKKVSSLEPEAYHFDNDKRLIKALGVEDTQKTDAPKESERELTEEEKLRNKRVDIINRKFKSHINNAIRFLLERYDLMFASGYQVFKPAGVPFPDQTGSVILQTVEDEKLVPVGDEIDAGYFIEVESLYEKVTSTSNIKMSQARTHQEIIRLVTTGEDVDGKKLNSSGKDLRVTLPYKMMEYAYNSTGIPNSAQRTLSDAERKVYPKSSVVTWAEYKDNIIRKDLNTLFASLGYTVLKNNNMEDVFDSGGRSKDKTKKAIKLVSDSIHSLQSMMASTILMSKYMRINDAVVAVKARILDNYTDWSKTKEDLVREAMLDSGIELESDRVLSYKPKYVGKDFKAFSEFSIELDHVLANAEPFWAYKALLILQKQGVKLGYSNAVLGIDKDGNIVQNGDQFNLQDYLTHVVLAGSRAGKGVWTSNMLAASIISNRPIWYFDCKPDIGDLFAEMSKINGVPTACVINGGLVASAPESEEDKAHASAHFFGNWGDANSWINKNHIPTYVQQDLSIEAGQYAGSVGTLAYLRGMLLFLGIVAARASLKGEVIEKLGGKNGVVGVFDEMGVYSSDFTKLIEKLSSKYPNQSYWDKYKASLESDGDPVDESKKPPISAYWSYLMCQAISISAQKMMNLNRAEGKDKESKLSDIFVISQDFFSLLDKGQPVFSRSELAKRPQNSDNKVGSTSSQDPTYSQPLAISRNVIFNMLLALGGDACFGRHDQYNYLNHWNKNSNTSAYINDSARFFGRIKQYPVADYNDTQRKIESEHSDVQIYKGGLIVANSDVVSGEGFDSKYTYFLDTVSENIKNNEADLNSIIQRSADPVRKDTFHRATALPEYLELAGVDKAEVANRLSKSGEITQFVVNALGYPGSWRDFILDLRPQWIFSVDDVINSLNPTKKKELAKEYNPETSSRYELMNEITTLYPDFFGNNATRSNQSGENVANGDSDSEIWIVEDGLATSAGGEPKNDDSLQEEMPEPIDYEPTSENLTDEQANPVEEPEEYYPEDDSPTESVETQFEDPNPVPETPLVEDTVVPRHEEAVSGINSSPEEWATGDNTPATDATTPMDPVKQFDDGSTINEYGDRVFGASTEAPEDYPGTQEDYVQRAQQAQSFRNPPKNSAAGMKLPVMGFDPMSMSSYDRVFQEVTNAIIRTAKSKNSRGIISLSIKDGDVIVNGVRVQVDVAEGDRVMMNDSLRKLLENGKLGSLINWVPLFRHMRMVEALEFSEIVDARSAGKAFFNDKDISVPHFFERMPTLQFMTLSRKSFTRRDYQEQLEDTPQFYNRTLFENIEKKVRDGSLYGASNSFAYARDRFSRKGGINKIAGIGAGVFGALLKSVAAASRTARGAATLGGRFRAARRMQQRNNTGQNGVNMR